MGNRLDNELRQITESIIMLKDGGGGTPSPVELAPGKQQVLGKATPPRKKKLQTIMKDPLEV
jgi:hypothetical protein